MSKSKIVKLLIIFCLLCSVVLAIAACKSAKMTIGFIVDGEMYATIDTSGNETLTMPANPIKDGYTFDGWYVDNDNDMPFDANSLAYSALTSNLTIYAKFSEIESSSQNYNWKIVVEPTCTSTGLFERINPDTNEKETKEIIPLGHAYGEDVTTQESTCMAEGSKHKTCFRCGDDVTVSIPKVEHSPSEWITVEQPSTCSTYRKQIKQCKFCETTLQTKLEVIDHDFGNDDICVNCGCSNLLYYTGVKNVFVADFKNKDVFHDKLIIPQFFNGNEVTDISSNAFADCDDIESITMPKTIQSIGSNAFADCDSLTSVTLPQGILEIGSKAFANCDKLITVIWNATACEKTANRNNSIFYESDNINEIIIGNNVKSICNDVFDWIPLHGTVHYEGDLESWCNIDFGNAESNPLHRFYDLYIGDQHLTELVIPDSVTEIKDYSFSGCNNLVSVTMGDSVLSVGKYSFMGCLDLTRATIGNNVTLIDDYAFSESCLTDITMGNSVKTIGKRAFNYCLFTEFTIPDGVKAIGYGAFTFCQNLKSITIPSSVTEIGADTFMYYNLENVDYKGTLEDWCNIDFGNEYANPLYFAHNLYINGQLITELVIPDTITKIKPYAFARCLSITNVVIPDSVTSIGKWAFEYCGNIDSISMGNAVKTVDTGAFYNCQSLTAIVLPNNVTTVGEKAFQDCSNALSVTIGDSVTTIGADAFDRCSSLTSVYYTGDIEDWCNISFGNMTANLLFYANNLYIDNELVTELVIPETVTEIKPWAFFYCTSITSVLIPNSVSTIGWCAFDGCHSLTSVTIGDSVTTVGENAFRCCSSLISLTISSSVTSIGESAFLDCNSLTEIYYKGTADDWANINVGSYNANLNSATRYYYSEAEPKLNADGTDYDGNYWHYVDGEVTVWKKES